MKFWRPFVTGCLLIAAAIAGRAQEARFTQTITGAERTSAGIGKLSSDQLAVLNALIRRDEKIIAFPDSGHPAPTLFSQRLTPDERKGAGLEELTSDELARLDGLVAGFETGSLTPAKADPDPALKSLVRRSMPEVHGMLSFTFGAGSGGYHEMGGSMVVSVDDPAHNWSLLVGYGEVHSNGPLFGRDCHRGFLTGYPDETLPPYFR